MLKYCFNRYKTQETRDKVDDDFLRALSWFVTSKVNKRMKKCFYFGLSIEVTKDFSTYEDLI